jgi:long-chain-fatty-acid--CoA ligase ACSBG
MIVTAVELMLLMQGSLNDTLREVRPTAFLGVPRVWEKIQEKLTSISSRQGFVRRFILSWARSIGLRGNMSVMNGWVNLADRRKLVAD